MGVTNGSRAWLVYALCGACMVLIALLVAILFERHAAVQASPAYDEVTAPRPGGRACKPAAEWITADDYPMLGVLFGHQGATRIRWSIAEDGRIASCRVIATSGHVTLDNAACRIVMKNGCYDPAMLPENRIVTRRIMWRLPDE